MDFINTFEDKSEHYAALVEKGYEFAVRFNAEGAFSAFRYISPVMAENGGRLTLSLFRFENDYQTTRESAPVAEREFDLADGTEMLLAFNSQHAGEYLLVAHDGTGGTGFCGLMDPFPNVQLYINGVPCDGSMEAAVGFDAGGAFGGLSAEQEYALRAPVFSDGDFTVPVRSWSAVDGLGRTVPALSGSRPEKKRAVGMFFWDWHYHFEYGVPVNVHEVNKAHPEAKNDFSSPVWRAGETTYYHWNEPIWGFYTSSDRYVLRKQAQMLAEADVDFIVFDNTNGTYTWKLGYETLLETFAEARRDGVKTPRIVFMLNFAPFRSSWVMLRQIYTDIYRKGRYADLWYYHDGKPLIIAHKDCLDPARPLDREILDFFTFRRNDPIYFTKEPTPPETWGWLSVNPQARYCVRDDGSCEQMTVGVAHNASERGLVPMNDIHGGVFGRSHTTDSGYKYVYRSLGRTVTVNAATENSHLYGLNFNEQFDRAIEVDPDVVFITGWNEWVAGRHPEWQGSPNAFPDEFNDEFSRDLEPSKGDLKDHYYMQLVANIRRYKGTGETPRTVRKTVDISDLSSWEGVPAIPHFRGTAPKRDNDGWKGTHYTDNSSRNEVVETRHAVDGENVYFYARCAGKITAPGANWMRLLISTDKAAGWEGFDFILNREGVCMLERSVGGWNWVPAGQAEICVQGDVITVKLPKALLPENADHIRYKWADNNLSEGDVLDLYTTGCTAPGGRFTITVKM